MRAPHGGMQQCESATAAAMQEHHRLARQWRCGCSTAAAMHESGMAGVIQDSHSTKCPCVILAKPGSGQESSAFFLSVTVDTPMHCWLPEQAPIPQQWNEADLPENSPTLVSIWTRVGGSALAWYCECSSRWSFLGPNCTLYK